MPRIAHIVSSPDRFGGAEQVLANLVQAGAERGWDQVVLHPFLRQPGATWLRERVQPAEYVSHAGARLQDLPATRRWLHRELTKFRPAVAHAHLLHAGVMVATMRAQHGRSTVWTHHHGSVLHHQGRRLSDVADGLAARRFDRVVAVSGAVREFLVQERGYRADRVETIRNGWQGTPEVVDAGRGGPPAVICVGHFRQEKGHEALVQAFAVTLRAVPDARLLLVGDGPLRPAVMATTERLGIGGSVEFVGQVGDVWSQLARGHVFALASQMEPLGIAALEAMAAGLPVVATAVGGLTEIVQHDKTGLLVPPADVSALAAALERLLLSAEDRRRLGRAGQVAAADMRIEAMTEHYFQLYDDLMSRQRS